MRERVHEIGFRDERGRARVVVPFRRPARRTIWPHVAMLFVGPILFAAIVGTVVLVAAAQAIAQSCED